MIQHNSSPSPAAPTARPVQPSPLQREYMSDRSAALLLQAPRGGRLLIGLVFCAVAAALLWASQAEIDEVTRGEGRIIPSSRLQVIQNLEGGILDRLLVKEGERVTRGQTLLELDATRFRADFGESDVQYHNTLAAISRLRAEAAGDGLQFPAELKDHPALVQRETRLFNSRKAALDAQRDSIKERIDQSRQAVRALETRRDHLKRNHELGNRELTLTRSFARQGIVSEVELLQLEQRINDLLAELREAELNLPRLRSTWKEQVNQEPELLLKFRQDALAELRNQEIRLARLREARKSLEDQVARRQVLAPLDGIVKKIHVTTLGGVVQPGMDLLEIVPVEDVLLVEAQIAPGDVAFLKPGDKAFVRLSAYDFALYGGLKGTVSYISADTIKDDNGRSFYRVHIRTPDPQLTGTRRPLAILPGMHAQVDIMTGKKTLLSYLTHPLVAARHKALGER